MNWLILIIAGIFEACFATCLGFMRTSEGTTRWWWFAGFVLCLCASMYLLYIATKTIPIGTAYAVWTGIGAAGTVIIGILIFREPSHWPRLGFLALLIFSIAGLKFFSN